MAPEGAWEVSPATLPCPIDCTGNDGLMPLGVVVVAVDIPYKTTTTTYE